LSDVAKGGAHVGRSRGMGMGLGMTCGNWTSKELGTAGNS